jgi:hypothetical protein
VLGVVVWQPWVGLELEARGLSPGTEITGGIQALAKLESTLVIIKALENDLDAAWEGIREAVGDDWGISLVSKNSENMQLVVEVGGIVTEGYLNNLIGAYGEVLDIRGGISQTTADETMSRFQRRLDPHGLKGVKIEVAAGDEAMVLIQTPIDFPSIEPFVKEGRLEIGVDDQLLVTDLDLWDVGMPVWREGKWGLPLFFTEEGENKLNAGLIGKADHPLVSYVDRPFDAIMIFDEMIVGALAGFTYDENILYFWETKLGYPLLTLALSTPGKENLPPEIQEYLKERENEFVRTILMGKRERFSEENYLNKIPPSYVKEFNVIRPLQAVDEWIVDTSGHVWAFPIDPVMAREGLERGAGLLIPVRGDLEDAKALRAVILNRLPTRITFLGETTIGAPFRLTFMKLTIASILGILGASFLVFCRYRHLLMGLLFFVMLLCNFIIVLGLVSVMHLTVGFAEVAGIFFVLGMYASQLLMVTDEMIGGASTREKMSIGWRAPKALSLVYTTTIFALISTLMMIALGTAAIWSFLLIFFTGSFLTTFLSKPLYTRALDYVYSRRAMPRAPAQ